jgi:hypothetical protein
MGVISFTPRPLYPQGKSTWYPLDRRLDGPRAVLDAVVKRKIPSPRRESNPRTLIVQPVAYAILTELSWLFCISNKHHIIINVKYNSGTALVKMLMS